VTVRWDPGQYSRFAGPRGRPFFDLVARIGAESPETVVDLGCGPGDLTVSLEARWPDARIRGIDSSREMIERTPRDTAVEFEVGSAEAFDATGLDVLISNATLQWVPTHRELLPRWLGQLNSGGWLAFQVPSNFGAPSHRLMRELAESPRWRDRLGGVLRHDDAVATPEEYFQLLGDADVWQTEYLHVLQGPDPVLEWVRGTGLRPILSALDASAAAEFEREYAALLREAYPETPRGTLFGFTRIFAVTHKR
jgi:trans-aconitate 2-methyltransferase